MQSHLSYLLTQRMIPYDMDIFISPYVWLICCLKQMREAIHWFPPITNPISSSRKEPFKMPYGQQTSSLCQWHWHKKFALDFWFSVLCDIVPVGPNDLPLSDETRLHFTLSTTKNYPRVIISKWVTRGMVSTCETERRGGVATITTTRAIIQ